MDRTPEGELDPPAHRGTGNRREAARPVVPGAGRLPEATERFGYEDGFQFNGSQSGTRKSSALRSPSATAFL